MFTGHPSPSDHRRKLTGLPALLLALGLLSGCSREPDMLQLTGPAQGTSYSVQWWLDPQQPLTAATDPQAISRDISAELDRIDRDLSN